MGGKLAERARGKEKVVRKKDENREATQAVVDGEFNAYVNACRPAWTSSSIISLYCVTRERIIALINRL